ncbi:MAG: FAD-binding oxidoreductase [Pseudonocardia sp.]
MSLLGFSRGSRRRGLASITGPVLRPADAGYAAEIAAFNTAVTRRPGIVVGADSEDDVVTAVAGAGADGLPVGVKGAGHGSTADPAAPVLLSTRRLDAVTVDPRARTARVGSGATWAQVLAAAAPHSLTALTPSSTRVGVAGYTLGGGLGLLGRRYGFAADHLRRLRLVTADGRPHEIDADRAPELHWALRGAGRSGFGVVTELEFALFPLTRLYGGGIVWPAAAAADVLHAWREWAPTLPDEAGTSVALLRVPRDAGWPAPLHDRTMVHVRFTGADVDAVSGDALLAALRTVGTPLLDEVGELSLTATDAVHRDPVAPAPVHDGGAALRELPAPAVDALLAAADVDVASPLTTVELRALGGALGRAPAVPAAVAGRGAAYALHVQGRLVEPVAADVPDAVATLLDAVAPWSLGAALPTFAGAGEPTELWSPRDRARLRLLRQAVDPKGMFAAPPPP